MNFARTLAALAVALLAFAAAAQPQERVELYLFWAQGCPHCEREIEFLKRLEAGEPRLRAHYLEVSRDAANRRAFAAVVERIALEDPAVPLTVVGEAAIVGYASDATTGAELRRLVASCLARGCPDTIGPLLQRPAGAGAAGGRRGSEARRPGTMGPAAPGQRHGGVGWRRSMMPQRRRPVEGLLAVLLFDVRFAWRLVRPATGSASARLTQRWQFRFE